MYSYPEQAAGPPRCCLRLAPRFRSFILALNTLPDCVAALSALDLATLHRASKRAPKASPSAKDDDGVQTAGKAGAKRGKGKKGTVDPSLLGFSVESSRIMQGEIQFAE